MVVSRTIHPLPRFPNSTRESRLPKLVVYNQCVFRRRWRTRKTHLLLTIHNTTSIICRGVLRTKDAEPEIDCGEDWESPYIYFGTFDGHAGSGCAVTAANELHQVVHKKLMNCLAHLIPKTEGGTNAYYATNGTSRGGSAMWFPPKDISGRFGRIFAVFTIGILIGSRPVFHFSLFGS